MILKRYSIEDEIHLFAMLKEEGDDWCDYHGEKGYDQYLKALESSITYLIYNECELCGYVRCREDDGFGIYIYDLLVKKTHRGKQFGKSLMGQICKDFPEQTVYVMSDADTYYEKLGFRRAGSVFEVKR